MAVDPQHWGQRLRDAEHLDDLLEQLGDVHGQPVAFMVGSALSSPAGDGLPGVPGVDGCVAIAREVVSQRRPRALTRFDEAVKGKEGSEKYAAAFDFLQRIGQDQANEAVRLATLRARTPDARRLETDSLTEADLDGWALSRGTRALGELLGKFPERYPGPVLTTNFDPLLSIAVERVGGRPNRIVFVKDRDPPSRAELRAHETQIVHLHGYWRDSDTMHTMDQLGARRERLERWCEEILRGRLLLVVGYAGWDDVFTRMIGSLADPHGIGLQVAWTFHSERPSQIIGNYARLLERFEDWRSTGRLRIYVGIDAHVLFERLLEQVRDEETSATPSATAAASTAAPAVVEPVEKPSPDAAMRQPSSRPPGQPGSRPWRRVGSTQFADLVYALGVSLPSVSEANAAAARAGVTRHLIRGGQGNPLLRWQAVLEQAIDDGVDDTLCAEALKLTKSAQLRAAVANWIGELR